MVDGVTIETAAPALRVPALELLRTVRPGIPPELPSGVELVVARDGGGTLVAVAMLDRVARRVAELAHRGEHLGALTALLARLAEQVPDALLWDQPASPVHHDALVRAGYALIAETVVLRRSLVIAPRPTQVFGHRTERELGPEAFAQLVAAALEGSPSRYLGAADPIAAFAARVPASFRARWWTAAELGGETVGVVLPSPEHERTVAMAFLGLLPAWRGRKLGSALLADALQRLAAAGAREYVDETDVKNVAAQRILIGVGCRRVGVRRRYVSPRQIAR